MREQYALVQSSRSVLLDYCATISAEHLVAVHPGFGRGSVRDMLIHIANVYELWIAEKALERDVTFTSPHDVLTIEHVRDVFRRVDSIVEDFFRFVVAEDKHMFQVERNGHRQNYSATSLFTHAITHEFHHKGQVLSLSRMLGYTPIDTDIIR